MKIEKMWTLQFALKTDRPIRQARHSEFISLNSEMRSLRLLKSSNLNQQHENTPLEISVISKDAENEIFNESEEISKRKIHLNVFSDLNQGQRNRICERHPLLQGVCLHQRQHQNSKKIHKIFKNEKLKPEGGKRDACRGKCGRLQRLCPTSCGHHP